jgi:hypothetical protein
MSRVCFFSALTVRLVLCNDYVEIAIYRCRYRFVVVKVVWVPNSLRLQAETERNKYELQLQLTVKPSIRFYERLVSNRLAKTLLLSSRLFHIASSHQK